MLGFTQYITEAKISSELLEKSVAVMRKLMEKEFSTKLYRWGGEKGYTDIKDGIGILLMYKQGGTIKAIRFNYIQGDLRSLTFWKKFIPGQKGTFTIDFEGLNLVKIASQVIEIISHEKPGMYPVLEESFITEAKRTTPDDFYAMVNDILTSAESMTKVSWDRIAKAAEANDVQVPSVVRSTKVKGGGNFFDLTKLLVQKDHDKVGKSEPIYYVKVTAQDPETKKFLTIKGDKKAENILRTIDGAVNNPDVEELARDPNSLFFNMKSLAKVVARGKRKSLVIVGGAGVGKSYTVFEAIQEEGLEKGKDWYLVKGKITTAALYQTLFMHREGALLVFDDTDSVWGDQDAANILKAALDSYDERIVSWLSARTTNISKMDPKEKEEYLANIDLKMKADPSDAKIKLPSEFEYKGRIIFISNLPIDKLDPAVLNRSAKIDMTLTDEEVFVRIKSILAHIGDKNVPLEIKEEILEFIKTETRKGVISAPSIRTFVGAEDLYNSGMPNWRDLLQYI